MSRTPFTRREALAAYASLLAASPVLRAQQKLAGEAPGRIAPVGELVNPFEFEAMAQRKLDPATFSEISGSDRKPFDRITFRPRAMVNSTKLDLTRVLFGDSLYTPILVGPTAQQKRFHPEGELEMARGASAAKTAMVVSSRSSFPLEQIAAEAKGASLWYQVFPESDMSAVHAKAQQAVKTGCKAVCLTLGAGDAPGAADWGAIDKLRQGLGVPFLLKGIMSPEEARTAVEKGVQGIIVSNWGDRTLTGVAQPIEVLPAVADAVGGKIPILIDGSFRRASDMLKALALGAQAVLLGRPPLWGLAAYGAEGVQTILELLQGELARNMAQNGRRDLGDIDRTLVVIHRR
jgi:isopentenyl diphosphate isomerase/L-lactate dehydrogenase-like FMN-dependent dehydrogenase